MNSKQRILLHLYGVKFAIALVRQYAIERVYLDNVAIARRLSDRYCPEMYLQEEFEVVWKRTDKTVS